MDIFRIIEIISVVFGLLYVVLMMRQNIWCWICGIISSALYILSCFHAKLYLEGGLNFYYVIVGFYGWYLWLQKNNTSEQTLRVSEWQAPLHIINILICAGLTILLGKIMQLHSDSPRPFFDAAITVFSFGATILEARKILSAWIYWFVINAASVMLMLDRNMNGYAILSAVTTILCVKGYLDWKKSKQQSESPAMR
ncbi:MAG TPA: nicotinamide riboside transporter PnuC [Arachidicoccus sp.]